MKLADTASVTRCIETLRQIPTQIGINPMHLAIKCDGLMGLNDLLVFSPDTITFFSADESSLDYTKLVIELISICETESEFISRVFSRPVEAFLEKGETLLPFSRLQLQKEMFKGPAESLKKGLNEFTQWAYLAEPFNTHYLNETLSKLSKSGRERFQRYLGPYQKGHVLFENVPCRRLLPCWPINEPLPFSETNGLALNLYEEMEPSTNTFHYGNLWLTKKETFRAVKQKLKQSEVKYKNIDLLKDSIEKLCCLDHSNVLDVGNADESHFFQWKLQIENYKKAFQGHSGILFTITQSGPIEQINSETSPFLRDGAPSLPYASLQEAIDSLNILIDEGHIKKGKKHFFERFIKDHQEIKKILEVGFNAGHSSELFLKERNDTKVLSFDIMHHFYTLLGNDYIEAVFPGRHQLIGGDSNQTVPKYHQEHPLEQFDLIFIDGGHTEECAAADIANLKKFAHKNTWVVMDDIEEYEDDKIAWWSEGPTNAWNKAIREGVIEEISRERSEEFGWAVGKYRS